MGKTVSVPHFNRDIVEYAFLLYFQNLRRYGAGNFYKDLLFFHLQPGVHKNSRSLAILTLEFDDVTTTIYIQHNI